jgi:hypothetical protein
MICPYTKNVTVALALCISILCPCGRGQDAPKQVWVARENNGDKPGMEYRVWLNADGNLAGEMWLFVVGEDGKDKERAKYPIANKKGDKQHFSFTYESGDGSVDRVAIRFAAELKRPEVLAVLEDARSGQPVELSFKKMVRSD